jgi:hypothetical protein
LIKSFLTILAVSVSCLGFTQNGLDAKPKKVKEIHIGVGHFVQCLNQPQSLSTFNKLSSLSLSHSDFHRFKWGMKDAIVREYQFGAAFVQLQRKNLRFERLIGLDVSAQFNHSYLFTGLQLELLESNTVENVETQTILEDLNVGAYFHDVLLLRPSYELRLHLNRRLNIKSSARIGIGVPIQNLLQYNTVQARLTRTLVDGEVVSEERSEYVQGDEVLAQQSFGLLLQPLLNAGIELRVYDYQPIFLSLEASIGKQFTTYQSFSTAWMYGAELKLITRF